MATLEANRSAKVARYATSAIALLRRGGVPTEEIVATVKAWTPAEWQTVRPTEAEPSSTTIRLTVARIEDRLEAQADPFKGVC